MSRAAYCTDFVAMPLLVLVLATFTTTLWDRLFRTYRARC